MIMKFQRAKNLKKKNFQTALIRKMSKGKNINTMESDNKKHEEQISSIEFDASKVDNAVLKRLIEEINYEQQHNINSYNRLHNRHNRTPGPRPTMPPQEPKP